MRLRFSIVLMAGTVLAVSLLGQATPPPKSGAIKPAPSSIQSTTGPAQMNTLPVTTPNPAAPITVDAVAQVTAILNYCSQVDRPNARKYALWLSNVLSGHSTEEMKGDEGSSTYRSVTGVVQKQLAALPVSPVVGGCKNLVAGM
jgi:hypothetical protein